MNQYTDTFQINAATNAELVRAVQAKIPAVLEQARITANGRNITVKTTFGKSATESGEEVLTASLFVVYDRAPERDFNLIEDTGTYTCGTYPAKEITEDE